MGKYRVGVAQPSIVESCERRRSDFPPSLTLDPIGFLRSPLATKVQAARQPRAAAGTPARIELLPGRNFEHALEDLAHWELIWVIFWFHLNPGWRPKVLPPRSTTGRKGVFSTRSPHRPNPIGMSVVRLERVDGLILHIRDADMLDGTPVLDLKPYVAYTDAHPAAGAGWLKDAAPSGTPAQPSDPVRAYVVQFEALAAEQAVWIEAHTGLAIRERIQATLALGPTPHPYRRIRRVDEWMQLSVKEWRVRFSVTEGDVRVIEVYSGFRASQLAAGAAEESLRPHREFLAIWPRERNPSGAP
jgi:tRNA-Thr(GGU) m(6)t(6)A37 methyltransferase TsaA